jgi:hypothetical protein
MTAIIGYWYFYNVEKSSKAHLKRMAQEMEQLQKAEYNLQNIQKVTIKKNVSNVPPRGILIVIHKEIVSTHTFLLPFCANIENASVDNKEKNRQPRFILFIFSLTFIISELVIMNKLTCLSVDIQYGRFVSDYKIVEDPMWEKGVRNSKQIQDGEDPRCCSQNGGVNQDGGFLNKKRLFNWKKLFDFVNVIFLEILEF